jgi:myosin protein heavy chain
LPNGGLGSNLEREKQLTATALRELEDARMFAEKERSTAEELRKTTSDQVKANKHLQLRILELETQLLESSSGGDKFLRSRLSELEERLHRQASDHTQEILKLKAESRSARELESQIATKEKLLARLQDESAKDKERVRHLVQTVEALQAEESTHLLASRRAEREARDAKERALQLEKELEEWKDRVQRFGSQRRSRQDLSFV